MSDSLNIGQIIEVPRERDAIHIAVAPVVANGPLLPGEAIGLLEEVDAMQLAHSSAFRSSGVGDIFSASDTSCSAERIHLVAMEFLILREKRRLKASNARL